ncbi:MULTISPECIES: cupin domain-containing protein [Halorussus]|uniref:cupin domain-containing protein n=1 Tax=Halorussus TaxID=1070314 RepID=UPI000E2127CF|nr:MULTISPECIES: cupin domain-containing protein [Halorussus]NHN58090.1 cupin domain-containing protein [Halorussus sp. JP-T4]
MEKTAIDDADSAAFDEGVDRRSLAEALGATDLALNHYRVPPGEEFPSGLHAHGDQEEVFVVLDGEATFETLAPRDEGGGDQQVSEWTAAAVTAAAGEAVRFAPGEYQSGRNAGDEDLVALALGAPRDSEDVRIPLACPECGHDYLGPEAGEDGEVRLVCPACGAEHAPDGCPDCGSEMRAALGGSADGPSAVRSETVAVCPDCGAEAATPFRS